jgi:hypothetical protein
MLPAVMRAVLVLPRASSRIEQNSPVAACSLCIPERTICTVGSVQSLSRTTLGLVCCSSHIYMCTPVTCAHTSWCTTPGAGCTRGCDCVNAETACVGGCMRGRMKHDTIVPFCFWHAAGYTRASACYLGWLRSTARRGGSLEGHWLPTASSPLCVLPYEPGLAPKRVIRQGPDPVK